MLGKTDYDFFPQSEAKINNEMDKEVIACGKSIIDKECYIPGNRKAKWGIMSKIPILDSEDRIEGVVGHFVDITARRKAEEEYDRIVNMSPNLICVTGMDGYFKFVNPAWEKLLGYTSDELLSKPVASFIHPDDIVRSNAERANLARGNLTLDFENRYIHKDGSIRHFLWTAAPIPDEKLIYSIAIDITERMEAEEALRVHQVELEMQNEELRRAHVELDALRGRYFDLYELAPVGFCTLSEKGLIREANVKTAAMLGMNRGALINQPFTRFILPEDQDIYYKKRKTLLATGKPQAWEMRMLQSDGSSFRAYLQAAPAQNKEFMITLNDISGLNKTE